MSTLFADVRYATRLLWKHKGFTAIATLVLALGIGADSAIFTIVNTMLLKPRVGNPKGELASLFVRDTTKPDSFRLFSYPEFEQLRKRQDIFASLTAHNLTMAGLREGETTRRLFIDIVSKDFFEAFGAPPLIGRAFTAEEEKPGADIPVTILSHTLWQKMGGSPSVLGQQIVLNNRPYTVIGVAQRGFGGSIVALVPDMFVPTGVYDSVSDELTREGASTKLADPRTFDLFVEGQLATGQTITSVAPSLKAMSAQMAIDDPGHMTNKEVFAGAMSRLSISSSPSDDKQLIPVSGILLGMSTIVLFIASFNLANMLLARNGSRSKEFAVRMAIGGSRRRVIRQLITEGFVLSLLGGIGGLALATSATKLMTVTLAPLLPITVSFDVVPDYRIVAATFGFCALATIIFSLGPALRLARTNLVPELKEQSGELSKRSRFAMRDVLVMAQLALSLALLTVAGLFVKGAVEAARVDPGFTFKSGMLIDVDAGLAGRSSSDTREIYRRATDRLRRVPGIAAVSFGSIMPFGEITESHSVQKPGAPVEGAQNLKSMSLGGGSTATERKDLVDSIATSIGTDYFDALGLKMLAGRDFTDAEVFSATPTHVAIIDEVLAKKLFGTPNPVGQQIQYKARQEGDAPIVLDIVGVAPGLKHSLTDREAVAHVYTPLSQDFRSNVIFHVRSQGTGANDAAMLPALRDALRETDSSLPVLRLETRPQYVERNFMLGVVRLGAGIFGVFGAVALVLATIGVYGVKAYIVSRRTREIGIRMALGASSSSVVSLVIKEGIVLSAVGFVIGLGLSVLAAMGVSAMLFQASPFDAVVAVAALAILAAATFAASWIPARRATRIAPVTALRS